MSKIKFNLNNNAFSLEIDPLKKLLDVIRNNFKLTGTKEGCSEGKCGHTLALLDDKPVFYGCMLNIIHAQGKKI